MGGGERERERCVFSPLTADQTIKRKTATLERETSTNTLKAQERE